MNTSGLITVGLRLFNGVISYGPFEYRVFKNSPLIYRILLLKVNKRSNSDILTENLTFVPFYASEHNSVPLF